MKHILFDLFLFSLGAGNNEFGTEFIQLVFEQCTEPCANGNCGYRRVSRIQA